MLKRIILYTLIIFFVSNLFANNINKAKRETRAVWVTTNFQLDWPPKVYDPEEQKKELIKIFDKIKNLKLNTVYFQVRSNGTVLFNSSYEDYPFFLTGSFDEKPSYDPLQFAIEEAHKRGLQIHAWVNVMRCFVSNGNIDLENPKHLYQKNRNWIRERMVGDKIQGWLDPGIFNARAYLIDLFSEIIENYDVDGLHLDFMRYPGKDFQDEETYIKSETEKDVHDWRRENINKFLQVLYIRSKLIRNDIKIGVTPIGIYKNQPEASGMQGFYDVYQDSELWINEKYVDYIVPQIYWDIETNPKFEILAEDWKKRGNNRKVILGIAAYKPEVKNQIKELINISRCINSDGVAFFRYNNIADMETSLFEDNSLPVPMEWLKGEVPALDMQLSYSYLDDEKKLVKFFWNQNDTSARSGYYLLIKSSEGEFSDDNVVLTIPADNTSVILNVKKPKRLVYKFSLMSMDRNFNLGDGKTNDVIIYPEILNPLRGLDTEFVNPQLVKEKNGNSKLLLNNKLPELIEVYHQSESRNELIFSEFVNSGKNIIQLPDNNYSTIIIKYQTSKKEVKLNL